MRFCHRVLGEAPARPRKAKHSTVSSAKGNAAPHVERSVDNSTTPSTASAPSEAAQVALLDDLLSYQRSPDDKPTIQSGPRIAKIKFANPGEL